MKRLFINSFNGKKVCCVIWKGKPCWVAIQVASLLDYKKPSRSIAHCIKAESFEIGVDYDILAKEELKAFKSLISEYDVSLLKQAVKVVILYEEGLYGFLQYTEMPIGIEFRKWIRRKVNVI